MTFPILGGNSAVTGAFSIDNSLRFNNDDSPKLKRTTTGSGTQSTYTFSTWCKRSGFGSYQYLFSHRASGGANAYGLAFDRDSEKLYVYSGSGLDLTTAVYRDASAWYHIVLSVSSGSYTLYVNGSSVKTGSAESIVLGESMTIGAYEYSTTVSFLDGYMAEVHFIDGTAKSPTDFGEFDSTSGIWKPKEYEGTYGTNGFKLNFSNSGSLGADSSGNGNNFTPTNLASTDQTTDTPTNNFCTLNSLNLTLGTLSQGNLYYSNGASWSNGVTGTQSFSGGKWYWEAKLGGTYSFIGIQDVDTVQTSNSADGAYKWTYNSNTGNKYNNNTYTSYGDSYSNGEIVGVAFDADNGTLTFYNEGVSQGTAFSSLDTSKRYAPFVNAYGSNLTLNFGQEGTFTGTETSQSNSDGNGYGNFYYSPPSGYLALCTQNLATELSPTISDGSQYFNTLTWSGDNTTRSFTGLGFSPDWVWIKNRNNSGGQVVYDSVRGNGKQLQTHESGAEQTNPQFGYVSSFDSDGFTLTPGTYPGYESGNVNMSGRTYVGWNWRGSDSSAVSNTDGSITSTVSANQTSGFSIVTYTGNNTQGATVGHGLGKAPAMIFVKGRDQLTNWNTWHKSFSDNEYIALDLTSAKATDGSTFPDASDMTSTTFEIGSASWVNGNNNTFVAYCFAEIEGYSKFGTYTGNQNADGVFVYTGFKPAFIITKKIDGAYNWGMLDATRSSFNVADDWLGANLYNAESVEPTRSADLLSNGFKARGTNGDINHNSPYLYMAFAENPFSTSGAVPVTAR